MTYVILCRDGDFLNVVCDENGIPQEWDNLSEAQQYHTDNCIHYFSEVIEIGI